MYGSGEVMTKKPTGTAVGLKREIGLVSAVNFVLCAIIGSGIFVTPGQVLAECGSVGMMLTVWAVCGAIAFLACLPFGELSTVVPKSGSIYIYLHSAFSSYHPFLGGLPAFVYIWIAFIITEPGSTALKAILFADYFYVIMQQFMSDAFLSHECLIKCSVGAAALISVGVINCVSVKLYINSQDLLSYAKMAAITFTIGCGVYMFFSGSARQFPPGFEGTNLSVKRLTQALYFGLYAYDGGWSITGITEELKNPQKNILLSIVIALTITIVTYLLLNITFLTALSVEEMSSGCTVIAEFALKMFGPSGGVIAAAVICVCLLTSIMCCTFCTSRLGYAAAREGHMVETLCYIHKTRQTPAPAVFAQIVLSLVYFFVGGDITVLIDMCSFFTWMFYGLTMVALFSLRKKFPNAYRPFKVPSAIPVLVMGISCFLVFESLMITEPALLLVFAVCVTMLVVLYYVFIYKAFRIKSLDTFQKYLQKQLLLVPPMEETKS